LFSGLAFFVMLKWLQRTLTITLDTDWFYRVFLVAVVHNVELAMTAVRDWMATRIREGGAHAWAAIRRLHDPDGILARTWQSGTMAMLMLIMLVTLLVIGYLE
jgi:multicomponent Na+:H+ antiporter subunit D